MAPGTRAARGLRAAIGWPVLLLVSLSTVACGSDGDGEKAPVGQGCEPSSEDLFAEALAFERELVIRGRADAMFEQAFGEESEALLDEADAQRTALIEQAAAGLGLELPDPVAMSQCPAAADGVAREPLSVNVQLAFGVTARALVDAAQRAPINGAEPSVPVTRTTTGLADDGSERTTATTFNIVTSGHDSTVTVTTTMSTEVTTGAGGTTESATVVGQIDVCPDPGGLSRGDIVIVLDGAVGESSTYHANSNQHFDFVVNDDAHAINTLEDSVFEYRATGAREADVRAHADAESPGESGSITIGNYVIDYTDGSPESMAMVERNLLTFAHSTAALVRPEAESKWRKGTCIEVEADPASDRVDPNAQLNVTATPKHKFDMSNVDATVVATLMGVKSLDKAGQRVPAPATYHYVAGSAFKDQGVIKLKSTSKRGIGEATATITVKCDESMPCPEGKTLNVDVCECQCTDVVACPAGQRWEDETCECVCQEEACGAGERWDTETCECVCDLQCEPGETLIADTCECEATCDIDPMIGNLSPDCVWTGTITITGNDSGSLEEPVVDRTRTWVFSYDASFAIQDDGTGLPTLDGLVSGSWEQTDVFSYPELDCSSTTTESASVSANLAREGMAFVAAGGDGNLTLSVLLPMETDLTGMTTYQGGGECGSGEPSALVKPAPAFYASSTASTSAFSGSESVDQSYFNLPTGGYAEFVMSWNLRLVRR
jgi:hypothetical protein